ncbi:hypothetical protein ADS79_19215 [Brevibacillus reuszeri]|uniref:Uncharacterized protein n=1 Tax=Brevibacillus reuszeri TaxID=54915 RepID=A0A0K9YRZ6_9BACL|nr:hypothetical protein ADS79_19215 [Brevibacillus reuszeri]
MVWSKGCTPRSGRKSKPSAAVRKSSPQRMRHRLRSRSCRCGSRCRLSSKIICSKCRPGIG